MERARLRLLRLRLLPCVSSHSSNTRRAAGTAHRYYASGTAAGPAVPTASAPPPSRITSLLDRAAAAAGGSSSSGSVPGGGSSVAEALWAPWHRRARVGTAALEQDRMGGTVEKLFCAEFGSGHEHVLLLHGLGTSHQYWLPLLQYMNLRKYKYICPDLLGHGRSDSAPQLNYDVDTHLYFILRDAISKIDRAHPFHPSHSNTSESEALGSQQQQQHSDASPAPHQHANAADHGIASSSSSSSSWHLDLSGTEKGFHIIGHGLGAILALELAARFPNRTISLTLISLPYFESEESATEHYMSSLAGPLLSQFKFVTKLGSNILANSKSTEWIKPIVDVLVRPVTSLVNSDAVKPDQLHATLASFQECIVKHRVDNAASFLCQHGTVPVTLLHGTADAHIPRQRVLAFYSKYGRICRVDLFEDAGHDLCVARAEQVARHITAAGH